MPTMQERQAMIQKIAELPQKLDEAIHGLNDRQLDTPYRDGGWTIRQVVHHLADSHMNAFLRIKWMLSEERTKIKTYDQEAWATSPEYAMPCEPALQLLRGLHARWTALLNSIITEEQWNRTADHPESGVVTIDRMLQMYSSHGEKHCGHIWGLRKKMSW